MHSYSWQADKYSAASDAETVCKVPCQIHFASALEFRDKLEV